MRHLMVLLWNVSRPELAARPLRSLLVAGTILVGVALLTAMRVATDSIVAGFASDLERLGGRADLQATFGTGEAGFPEELLGRVATEPFVAQAAAMVRASVTIEDEPRETVELFGLDVLQADVLDLYDVEVLERERDDFAILDDPRAVFVTDTIARERGLALGSRVTITGVDGTHQYTVRGIAATKGLAEFLGGRLVAMYLPAAQPVAGRRGDLTASMIDQIDLRLRPRVDADAAAKRLEEILGPGFLVSEPFQRRLLGGRIVEGLRATLVGMSSLVLLSAVFILHASTSTLVVQRLPAMATLVTLGASPRALVHTMVAEAGILAFAGSLGGVLAGILLASFVGEDVAIGMGLNYSLPFSLRSVTVDPWIVFVAHPIGGVLTATVSAWLPARRLHDSAPLVLQRGEDALEHRATIPLGASLLLAIATGVVGAALLHHGVGRGSAGVVSAGGVVVIVAAVLGLMPVLRLSWKAVVAPLARFAGVAGRIAGESLLRAQDRSLVTASAIALSCAVAVGAASLVESFRGSVAGWYGFSGDVLVASRSVSGGWLASPVSSRFRAPLASLPGVEAVETLRILQGQPWRGDRIAIAALSDGLLARAVALGTPSEGMGRSEALEAIRSGRGVAVSRNFATHFAGADGALELATVHGPWTVPVVAVVPDYVSDRGSVILPARVLAERWEDRLVNYHAIDLAPGVDIDLLHDALAEGALAGSGMAAVETPRMVERVDGLIGQAFADIDTIKLLVLFLTMVGITDLVVSNVLSRRRELAVLRVVGLADRQLARIARLEGICLAVGAALGGVAIGCLCAWVWVAFNYPVLVGYVLDLRFSWSSVVACVVLAVGAAVLGGGVGARFALGQGALSAMRHEA